MDPLGLLLILLVVLPGLWALAGIAFDARLVWRRATRFVIGTAFVADVAFLVTVAVDVGSRHGCPFNGCA